MLREVTVRKSPVLVWGESHSMVNRLSKKKERDGGNENQSRDKVIPGKWAREERRKGGKNRDVWKHISIVFARRRLDSSSSGHSDYLRGRGPKKIRKNQKSRVQRLLREAFRLSQSVGSSRVDLLQNVMRAGWKFSSWNQEKIRVLRHVSKSRRRQ